MGHFGGNILCQNGNIEWDDRSEQIEQIWAEWEAAMEKAEIVGLEEPTPAAQMN